MGFRAYTVPRTASPLKTLPRKGITGTDAPGYRSILPTAKAKGLSTSRIITHHALHAGLLPLVSYLGPAIADIVSGSLIVEQIFGLPGIGRYFVQAALNRDYTMVMGVTVFYGALVIFCNLVADMLYGVLDPKVRFD